MFDVEALYESINVLAQNPSELSFRGLVALVETCPEIESGPLIEAIESHIRDWPDGFRRAPRSQCLALAYGYQQRCWPLIRTITPGGNPEELTSPEGMPAGVRWFQSAQLHNVTRLDLGGLEISDQEASEIAYAPFASNLYALNLNENEITDSGLDQLTASPLPQHVVEWGLSGNQFSADALKLLLDASTPGQISHLSIGNDQIRCPEAVRILDHPALAELNSLALSLDISRKDSAQLLAVPAFSNVRRLSIVDTELDSAAISELLSSNTIARLSALNLSQFSVAETELLSPLASVFSKAASFRKLETLSLSGIPLDLGVIHALLSCLNSPLRTLDLSRSMLTDDGIIALSRSSALGQLEILRLCNNKQLSSEAAFALATSSYLSQLRTLDISGCRIGAEGLLSLINSPKLPKLTSLICRDLPLGPHFVFTPSESMPTSALRTLDFWNCNMSSAGLESLLNHNRSKELDVLSIGGNPLIETDALRQLLKSSHLATVRVLDLSFLEIKENCIEALATSPHLAKLLVLRLNGCEIPREMIRLLSLCPHLASLEELALYTPDGIDELLLSPILRPEVKSVYQELLEKREQLRQA